MVKIDILQVSSGALITAKADLLAATRRESIEKERMIAKYRREARTFNILARRAGSPRQLLNVKGIQNGLLVASGLSLRSIERLDKSAKTEVIADLLTVVLAPSRGKFADTLEQLYLRTKRRVLNREFPNLADALAYQRFFRTLISVLSLAGVKYRWNDAGSSVWVNSTQNNTGIEKRMRAISWEINGRNRLLATQTNLPFSGKNVSVALFDATTHDYRVDDQVFFGQYTHYLALGELKGCIDPARAKQHWKYADLALTEIRSRFYDIGLNPPTFFIGAAIKRSMAVEIVAQLDKGILSRAANLTKDDQLVLLCEWLVNL